jgi:hypothetical protein
MNEFVGRASLLSAILGRDTDIPRVDDLAGEPGAGKTSILRRLELAEQFRGVRVNLEDFDPGHAHERGESASVGAVQGSFQQFAMLLSELLAQVDPAAVAEFNVEIIAAQNAEVEDRRVFSLEESMEQLAGKLSAQELADAWRTAARVVAEGFTARWNAAPQDRCRLLLLDNVGEIAEQEFGDWLGQLFRRLENTVVVLTREPDATIPSLHDSVSNRSYEVRNFDLEEVKAYLDKEHPGRYSAQDAGLMYEASGGHPATLAIVLELASLSRTTSLTKLLDNLPLEVPSQRVALLVQRLIGELGNPLLSEALWAATVPRRFDADLLGTLLERRNVSRDAIPELWLALRRLPFTEDLVPGGTALRLHTYVRTALLDWMAQFLPERLDAAHELVMDYNYQPLTKEEAGYGDQYVYENPEWQARKREWLYHLGFVARDDLRRVTEAAGTAHATTSTAFSREQALLECARVFLDAFWWWGSYIRFDFCDRLVSDLDHLVRRRRAGTSGLGQAALAGGTRPGQDEWPQLMSLHDAFRSILRGYPPRASKPAAADWKSVRQALLKVNQVCGLQVPDQRPWSADQRHVAALLAIFLAHTYRYWERQREQADDYYRKAAALLEGGDSWSWPWVAFERAELAYDTGAPEAVSDLWRKAADLVQPSAEPFEVPIEPDDELAANLHRLRADCCWGLGEHQRAGAWYGRAVLHAYLFHFAPLGRRLPPDEYTLQFYVDIRARALNRLVSIWSKGAQQNALDCAEEMLRVTREAFPFERWPDRAELHALLETGKPVPLALALFPAGPAVSELRRETVYGDLFNERYEGMDKRAAYTDLHEAAWP